MPPQHQEILEKIYILFNARDIDGIFKHLHDSVLWPNGWEGGFLMGKEAVRDYWTRQWKELDPYVDPINFKDNLNNEVEADVHQIIRNNRGEVLADQLVKHIYIIENDLIVCMNIAPL